MDVLVKPKPPSELSAEFQSPAALSISSLDRKAFRVWHEQIPFDCYLRRHGNGDRLFVMLHGAIRRGTHIPPIFARWDWESKVGGHILCISDPTLGFSDEVSIGWYVGDATRNPLPGLTAIADAVAKHLGAPRTLFFGSSAGGFGAIAAACHSGGTAIALNPQTDIVRYRHCVTPVAKLFVGKRDPAGARDAFPTRWLAARALQQAREAGRDPTLIIGQNTDDSEHLQAQLSPFCEAFGVPVGGELGAIRTHLFHTPGGHSVTPPIGIIRDLIAMA